MKIEQYFLQHFKQKLLFINCSKKCTKIIFKQQPAFARADHKLLLLVSKSQCNKAMDDSESVNTFIEPTRNQLNC